MRDAVAKVFANLDESKPLWRANWALQNSPEVISTDLEWHPTNRRIGGVKNRADAAKRMIREKNQNKNQNQNDDDDETLSSTLFADAEHTGYMDPLSALPSTAAEAGETMHLRVEYETIRRLPGPTRATSRWILFTVRTHVGALDSLDAGTAAALRDAIEATGEAELAYKSLADETLRRATVAFLEQRSEGADERGGGDGGALKGGGGGVKKGGGVAFAASVDVSESTDSRAEASSMNNVVATGGPTGDAAAEPEASSEVRAAAKAEEEAAAAARPSRAPFFSSDFAARLPRVSSPPSFFSSTSSFRGVPRGFRVSARPRALALERPRPRAGVGAARELVRRPPRGGGCGDRARPRYLPAPVVCGRARRRTSPSPARGSRASSRTSSSSSFAARTGRCARSTTRARTKARRWYQARRGPARTGFSRVSKRRAGRVRTRKEGTTSTFRTRGRTKPERKTERETESDPRRRRRRPTRDPAAGRFGRASSRKRRAAPG